MRKMSKLQKIYAYILAPILSVKVFIKHALAQEDRNGIKKGVPLTGKKNACFGQDIPL